MVHGHRGSGLPSHHEPGGPGPECELDYVPNEGKKGRIRAAISETFGFGGHNGVVVIKEYRE